MKKQMSHGSRSTSSSSSKSNSSRSIAASKKGLDSAVKSNMGAEASMNGRKSSTRSSDTKRR